MPTPNKCLADIVADVLDKTVDIQKEQSNSIASLSESLRASQKDIESISAQFTNGFRKEMKDHVAAVIDPLKESLAKNEKLTIDVIKEVKSYSRIGFWAKIFGAFLVTMLSIAYTAAQIITALTKHDIIDIRTLVQDLKTSNINLQKQLDDIEKRKPNATTDRSNN